VINQSCIRRKCSCCLSRVVLGIASSDLNVRPEFERETKSSSTTTSRSSSMSDQHNHGTKKNDDDPDTDSIQSSNKISSTTSLSSQSWSEISLRSAASGSDINYALRRGFSSISSFVNEVNDASNYCITNQSTDQQSNQSYVHL